MALCLRVQFFLVNPVYILCTTAVTSWLRIGKSHCIGTWLYGTCWITCQGTLTHSEGAFSVFESRCHLLHRCNPVKTLPPCQRTQLVNLLAISQHYPLNAEHKAVCILLFCSFAHLFAKLPQPEYSKGTFSVFRSSCHLLLSV